MKYTKTEIKEFRETVCPQCNSNINCEQTDSHCANCPRIFNWKVYGDPEGLTPEWRMIRGNITKNAK